MLDRRKLVGMLALILLSFAQWPTVARAGAGSASAGAPDWSDGPQLPGLKQACSQPAIRMDAPSPDDNKDLYWVTLQIDCPELISRIDLQVISGGKQVPTECQGSGVEPGCAIFNPSFTHNVGLSRADWQSGQGYVIRVKAIDGNGDQILRDADRGSGDEDLAILAQSETIDYQLQTVELEILSKKITFESHACGWQDQKSGTLQLRLSIASGAEQVARYKAYIEGKTGGANIEGAETEGPFLTPSVALPLPEILWQEPDSEGYLAKVELYSSQGMLLDSAEEPVGVPSPKEPTLFARARCALVNQQIFLMAIIAALSSASAILIYTKRGETGKSDFSRPPADYTQLSSQAPRVQVKVEALPGGAHHAVEKILSPPCLIGRHPACDLHIPASQVSRRHAQITAEGHRLFLTDLGSANGTFIGARRLEPNQPVQLIGATQVRLGQHTVILVSPI